jgi:hypothetical protein
MSTVRERSVRCARPWNGAAGKRFVKFAQRLPLTPGDIEF